MGKARTILGDSLRWTVRNLDVIAIVFIATSILAAVRVPFSSCPQDSLFWAWASWSLAFASFLCRSSVPGKSPKTFLLSLFDIIFILLVSIHNFSGIQLFPYLEGLSLCLVLLMFTAIHCGLIFPEFRKCSWNRNQKSSMIVLSGAAVLSAILALFVPQWMIVLVLDTVTLFAILLSRRPSN